MPNATLSVGAYGPSVARLQALLGQQGFSLPGSEVNRSFFGPVTRQAVQEVQKKIGLPVTGEVDERTDSMIGTLVPTRMMGVTMAEPSTVQPVRPGGATTELSPPVVATTTFTKLPSTNLSKSVLAALTDTTIDSGTKTALSDTLNAALKSELTSVSNSAGYTELANLIQLIPAVDLTAHKDLSLRDFVAKEITLPTNPTQKAAVEAAIASLSTTTTVGNLLGLNSNINTNLLLTQVVKQVDLSTLLGTSSKLSTNASLIGDFVSQYAAFNGSLSDFWTSLTKNSEFEAMVPELQLTLQLGTLTFDNPPLVSALLAQNPQLSTPRTLTSLAAADWEKIITDSKVPIPTAITGATAQEKVTNYTTAILTTLRQAFPGAYFVQGLQTSVSASTSPVDKGIATFLKNATDFDILDTNLSAYLVGKKQTAFQGVDPSLQSAVSSALGSWQRVARVASDFPTASILHAAGLFSAFQIASTPRASFIGRFAGSLGTRSAAEAIYARAQHIAAQGTAMVSNINLTRSVAPVRVIGNVGPQVDQSLGGTGTSSTTSNPGIANWQTLFGPLSSCTCTDCRSLYSAAAYLVDLLQFLKKSGANSNGYTPFDVLVARRPDIPYIKLNCPNTDTELPYVDLVNEILEYFVANQGKLSASAAHDTPADATTNELSVNPEYTDADAYNTYLNAANFPSTLPYDRWLATARTYLNFMGSSLYQLMSSCQTGANATDFTKGSPSGIAIACEYLNISEAECAILTGKDFSGNVPTNPAPPPLYAFYGYSAPTVTGGVKWELDVAGNVSASSTTPSIGVLNFLNRTAIAYKDLVALLGTCALNPNLNILLQAPPAAPCDLTQTALVDLSSADSSLSDTTLSLMHRFIRLLKKIGGAISDLDKTMTGLGATDIDQPFLVSLAALKQNQAAMNLPLLQALTFWSNLDTDGRDSLYLTLFQNKAILNPPDSAFQLKYAATLTDPPTLQFPSPVFPNLSYESGSITVLTEISSAEFIELQLASTDPNWQGFVTAIGEIGALGFSYVGHAVPLAPLPIAQLPAGLYQGGQITYTGQMPDDFRDQLNFSNDIRYQMAVDAVYNMRTLPPLSTTVVDSVTLPGITNHINTILAALGINAQDLASLRSFLNLTDLGPPNPPVPLTLANLSAICRYVFLAQALNLSITDLITVVQLVAVDPFKGQNPAGTLGFVKIVQAIQASPFSIAQLNYLYRNVYDPNVGIAPLPPNIKLFLTNLQMGLAAIVNADAIVPDPKGTLLLKNLGTLLGNSLATTAVGLITGTGVFSAPLPALLGIPLSGFVTYDINGQQLSISVAMTTALRTTLLGLSTDPVYQTAVNNLYTASQAGGTVTYSQPLPALLSIAFPTLPSGATITYDNIAQQLRFTGAMSTTDQTTLLALSSNSLYTAAIQNIRQQQTSFISANLIFLDPTDATAQLIDNIANTAAEKVAYVTAKLMPYLQQIQSKSLVTQSLCTNLGLNSQLGGPLLNKILKSQVNASGSVFAMADFLALIGDGLTATYYPNINLNAPPAATRIDATIDFDWGYGFPDPSITARPFSAKWVGYVMPQYSENYTFYVDAGDGVRLSVNGTQIINRWADQMPGETPGTLPNNFAFVAGQLYQIELDYYDHTASGTVTLSWSSPSTPKAVIPQTQLFSGRVITSLNPIINSYTLLYKTNLLFSTFPLTPSDVAYLFQNGKNFAGTDPTNPAISLPFDPNEIPITTGTYQPALFAQWQRLNAIVNLRNAFPGGDAGLLTIFSTASNGPASQSLNSTSDPLVTTIAQATGWSPVDLMSLTGPNGFNLTYADFVNEIGTKGIGLTQLQLCMALVNRLGISAAQLFTWAHFISTPQNEAVTATDIQNTVKSKYNDATWTTVGKPLNDSIRQSSKGALIAYIFANAAAWNLKAPDDGTPITTADQLYEFFLIDVEMTTCMLTSRIVQANAAIQLFVQRCLLNLESADPVMSVSPAVIDTTYWNWMQNFRVWQANRQVFLYPENWMIPSLRDDKTPFFEDLENTLLQNPVTADTAEQAYLDYLAALDAVARLDIRGTYWQFDPSSGPAPDGTPDATNDVLHVFARTTTQPYVYYYRRLINCSQFELSWSGALWTPWEKIDLDVQADHLVPVVWDGRLYLFWPTFSQSADPNTNAQSVPTAQPNQPYTATPPVMDLSITLNWSEYKQGAWSPKSSSDPLVFHNFSKTYPLSINLGGSSLDTSVFELHAEPPNGDSLTINISFSPVQVPDFGNYAGNIAEFVFSACGGSPVGSALGWLPPMEGVILIPQDTLNSFNSLLGGNSLTVAIGIAPPLVTNEESDEPIELLGPYPTANSYSLMFPHQFYDSFGLKVPVPYSELNYLQWNLNPSAPLTGPMLVNLGQPFFYQDDQRVYFVTDTFTVSSLAVSDVNQESAYYRRSQLNVTPQLQNVSAIFPKMASKALTTNATPSSNSIKQLTATPSTIPETGGGVGGATQPTRLDQVLFSTFFHPHVCSFIKAVNRYGLSGFLTLANQALNNDNGVIAGFVLEYAPPNFILTPGVLAAQGQLYEATTTTTIPAPLATIGTFALYYNPSNRFYWSPPAAPTPGDTFLGTVAFVPPTFTPDLGGSTVFESQYQPNSSYISPDTYPRENVDFSPTGAYSIYNWELFFHIPLLIATQLSANQQFADAQTWFHYIFNPLSSSSDPVPSRYWNFMPFYECAPWDNLAGQWLLLLGLGPSVCAQNFSNQINDWKSNPFNPFVIARMRTIAFRMNVVMAYLNNLIAWGDNLFGQNTRESINEATQIYVLAKEILGPRPIQIPQRGESVNYTYNDLATLFGIDNYLSNAVVLIENDLPYVTGFGGPASSGMPAAVSMASPADYFCLPPNDTLMGYWDTVDDRLYKIRHCMNIQGVVEQLPLFSPPISPALLVAATSAGVDLSSVLSNTSAGTPFYRFSAILQKALELCAEVKSLGAALLAALEKQDAEALALLRATQETNLLQATQQMKELAVQEAQANLAASQASLQMATDRQNYYAGLHQAGLLQQETAQQAALQSAATYQQSSIQDYQNASTDVWIPEFSMGISGFGGSPTATIAAGGSQMAADDNASAAIAQANAGIQSNQSSQLGLQTQWARRDADWVFQAAQATDEMSQINAQIGAATYRVQIAQDDQQNLNLQIQNAQAVQDFLTSKYTSAQLYSWMVGQISTVFFQCYQMAYDLATQAEAAFRFERCLTTSSYIQFGYWDSLKKGLMSGEKLYADLKRMEIAYLETDVREYEITKSISLVLFDPWALISLKKTGCCYLNLPEAYFDLDYPGHYFRRLRTVSITIPSVPGPYTSVNCTLTLLNSRIRVDTNASSVQDYGSDAHFITDNASTQSIVTSTAQNDDGMFELNFRDERYLPFEGAGLISNWQIEMPMDCNAFDFDSITDVVITIRYTSRYGGDQLRDAARKAAVLPARPAQQAETLVPFPAQNNLQRFFSLKHEYPSEWYKFLNPPDTVVNPSMQIALDRTRFPYQYRAAATLKISKVEVVLIFKDPQTQLAYQQAGATGQVVLQIGPPTNLSNVSLASNQALLNGAAYGVISQPAQPSAPTPGTPASWTIQATGANIAKTALNLPVTTGGTTYNHLNPAAISDIFLVCQFSVTWPTV